MKPIIAFLPVGIVTLHLLFGFGVLAQEKAPPPDSPPSKQPVGKEAAGSQATLLPVSVARNGFTPKQAADLISRYSYEGSLEAGDVALFTLLNNGTSLSTTQISRVGNVVPLEKAPNNKIGLIRYKGTLGDLSLAEYLAHPQPRAQGMQVVHQGRTLFEEYPGMRDYDNKAWMSNAKTIVGFVIYALAQEGKIDLQKPIETYLPEFGATAWRA